MNVVYSIYSDYYYEDSPEAGLFLGIVLLLIGIFMLARAFALKKIIKENTNNIVKGRVIKVDVEESRDIEGNLIKKRYVLSIEYLINNQSVIGKLESRKNYPVNSVLDINVSNGGITAIVSNLPKSLSNIIINSICVIVLSISIIVLEILRILKLNNFILVPILQMLAILILVFLGLKLLYNIYNRANKGQKNGYEKMQAKIVDISNKGVNALYPIVEYMYNGERKEVIVFDNIDKCSLNRGDYMTVYVDRKTGDVKSKGDLTNDKIKKVIVIAIILIIIFILVEGFIATKSIQG